MCRLLSFMWYSTAGSPHARCLASTLVYYILGIRIRSVYTPSAHLPDLWTNTCGLLLVGVARAFETVGHACVTKCEKEGKAYVLRCKSSRTWARFRTAQNARILSFLKATTRFICFATRCCSHSYSSFSTRTSWRCGCIYALSSLPFSSQSPTLSSSLLSQFSPFWRRETASAATALRMISLRTCTQLFVKRIF